MSCAAHQDECECVACAFVRLRFSSFTTLRRKIHASGKYKILKAQLSLGSTVISAVCHAHHAGEHASAQPFCLEDGLDVKLIGVGEDPLLDSVSLDELNSL